jgi:glycosyltransferase involved in cell wall biosynthesis
MVRPGRSRVRGLRRLLCFLDALKIPGLAIHAARRARSNTVILVQPWGGELGTELSVAAYLAHRLSGAPFIVFEMDEWRAAAVRHLWHLRMLERLFHGRLLRAASTVWVISDQMAELFRTRFGVDSRVLPGCVEVDAYSRRRPGQRVHQDRFRLLYTGAVYGAQASAIRLVLRAIQAHPEKRITLVLYTHESVEELAAQGISGPGLQVEQAVPFERMPDVLATADALLLPLSFDKAHQEIVSTSLPSKIGDYLASGVPVLVLAPPYATITRLARDEGWAEIVDEPCPDHLICALDRLANDEDRRVELGSKARTIAYSRHDLAKRRSEFVSALKEAVASQRN